MLNDIIRFKIHVQQSLEDYEEFVAQEVEKECEEQENGPLAPAPPAEGSSGQKLDEDIEMDD